MPLSRTGEGPKKTLLLAAFCASLSTSSKPGAAAFSVGQPSTLGPIHPCAPRALATCLSASPNDDDDEEDDDLYFFTAPTSKDTTTTSSSSSDAAGILSSEQQELEAMQASPQIEESSSSSSSSPAAQRRAVMDVDGNGTGALMNRSHTAGGVDAPLMVTTHKPRAFPIDSGKDGMAAQDTKARTRPKAHHNQDPSLPKTRLVRYKLSPQTPTQEKTQPTTKLVLASSLSRPNGKLAKAIESQQPQQQQQSPKLVRYNGPDVENTTDYDGMELASSKNKRNRQLELKKANLVRYQGASQQKRLEEVADSPSQDEATSEQRKTLSEDLGYANRYTGPTDFSLAKKTGLAVNKPISLWVERDKFL